VVASVLRRASVAKPLRVSGNGFRGAEAYLIRTRVPIG